MVKESPSNHSRKPLQEANVNLQSEEIRSTAGRSWWSFKSFSSPRGSESSRKAYQQQQQKSQLPTKPLPCSARPLTNYVVMIAASSGSSLISILSQVYGGPLRSIKQVQSDPYPILLLEFVTDVGAKICRHSIDNQRFVVNGVPVKLLEPSNEDLALLSRRMNTETSSGISRRTLELFRPARLGFERPELVQSDVHPQQLMEIFSAIGEVLQVRPMIYQKHVAFAIDFEDIESAVKAKQLFDQEFMFDAEIRERHLSYCLFEDLYDWSLEFSRDSSERNGWF